MIVMSSLSLALGLRPLESPFPWQEDLLARFAGGDIPSALDVPTGLGKTAVIAIWLVARANGAPVPRRLIYIVDRRAVVDQATGVAEHMRDLVDREPELKAQLGLTPDHSLPISTLRGQHIDNREWLEDPTFPAIVIGTVDMIGSRLLFEGYGVSRKMRPYHAGLLGADTLVVLDEAHLVPPFERLIEAVAAGIDGNGQSLRCADAFQGVVAPLRFMSLSATGRTRGDALTLSHRDLAHPIVARRLAARKQAHLREEVEARDLAEKLADEAWTLSGGGAKALRCVVFCNRRGEAQRVAAALVARCKKTGGQEDDVELFVGGRRFFEREQVARWLTAHGFLAGSDHRPSRPTFLVATSAGEVGVDLDADHMVSDLVAWERMVQRLGRVNRRGDGDATVVVIPEAPEDAEAAARQEAALALMRALPVVADGSFDVSPGALTALRARCASDSTLGDLVERASTPAPLHPPLTRATVEAWSMTSLAEHTGRPDVARWVRGWVDDPPQTTIVWRRHLPVTDEGELLGKRDLEAFLEAATPHLAERLETETWRAVEWLGKRLKAITFPGWSESELDLNGRPLGRDPILAILLKRSQSPEALKLGALSTKDQRTRLQRSLEGGLLIVDERVGGLADGLLADDIEHASDVTLIDGPERAVPFRVRRVTTTDDVEDPSTWRTELRIAVGESGGEETAWLLVESLVREAPESEEGRSAGAARAQPLAEHEEWAEQAAQRIAERLALPGPYAEMLAVAARLHDEGKKARLWQLAFRAPPGDVYAKTVSRPNVKLLAGYRHELGSLGYAECHERVRALDEPFRDLCLHLIAAHHGNARPLLRTDGAEEPPSRLAERAQEVALRFSRLEKRWGPWGLAWWESLLRAADQQASRRLDVEGGRRG